jgi:hypothetical protein
MSHEKKFRVRIIIIIITTIIIFMRQLMEIDPCGSKSFYLFFLFYFYFFHSTKTLYFVFDVYFYTRCVHTIYFNPYSARIVLYVYFYVANITNIFIMQL